VTLPEVGARHPVVPPPSRAPGMVLAVAFLPLANVFHRKARTAVAVLAVAVSVATVMLFVGLARGTLDAIAHRLESVGADVLFQPPEASLVLGVSTAVLPLALVGRVAAVEGVTAVAPVLNWHVSQLKGDPESLNLWAVDPASFAALAGGFDLLAGRTLRDPGDVILDSLLAQKHGLAPGDSVMMLNRRFQVAGICRPGSGGRIYARIPDIGEAIGNPGKASFFLVKGGGSHDAGALTGRVAKSFPGYRVTAVAQVSKELNDNVVGLRELEGAVSLLAVVVSFLVVLLAMYSAVLERRREIGILRAMGATPAWVVTTILMESGLVCVVGIAAGVALALLGRYGLTRLYPSETVAFTLRLATTAATIGGMSGLVGSAYPALRAARLDPAQALNTD